MAVTPLASSPFPLSSPGGGFPARHPIRRCAGVAPGHSSAPALSCRLHFPFAALRQGRRRPFPLPHGPAPPLLFLARRFIPADIPDRYPGKGKGPCQPLTGLSCPLLRYAAVRMGRAIACGYVTPPAISLFFRLRDPHGIRRIARSAPPCGRRSACVFPLARSLSLRSLTLAHQLTPLHLTTLLLDGPLRRPLRRYTAHAGGSATPVATAP
jgi:hypothetical protein